MSNEISFTLNGSRMTLTREAVERSVADLTPNSIQKHAVSVRGVWFPVRQVFGAATRLGPSEFTSHTALRHLAALGFEISGGTPSRTHEVVAHGASTSRDVRHRDESWHTEAHVQASVVAWLAGRGWRVLSVADTASRQHGIDIVAEQGGRTVGIEVKGYPSRAYADPARSSEPKRTQPSNQATHWYSQAVLAAMRLRGRRPEMESVIALPDFSRYRNLFLETESSLSSAQIRVWWVDAHGNVEV